MLRIDIIFQWMIVIGIRFGNYFTTRMNKSSKIRRNENIDIIFILHYFYIQWSKVNIKKIDRYKKESFYNFVRFIFFYISPFSECYAFQNNSKLLKCWISICRIWNALKLLHLNFMIIKMFLQIIMEAKILWITLGINQITMSLLFYSVVLIQITFVISLSA